MTSEKQRIAIAEACGWVYLGKNKNPGWYLEPLDAAEFMVVQYPWGKNGNRGPLPNYLTDLNAMHEAEKVLTRSQRVKFIDELCSIVGLSWRPTSHFDTIHATATQRAEAFLRTIGKWEETS